MAKFVVYCGCGSKCDALVHCRRCDMVAGTPNCECGRQVKTVHVHACGKCTKSGTYSDTMTSAFDPSAKWNRAETYDRYDRVATYSQVPLKIVRQLPKIKYVEPVKETPKEYVEAWEYDKKGRLIHHEIVGFKRVVKA